MVAKRDIWLSNARGVSIIEVIVALFIFTIVVLGLAASGLVASQTLRSGRSFIASSAVAQTKLDSLTAMGWDSIAGASGTDNVQGFPVSWNVLGTNPRRVIVVVQRTAPTGVFADTFVTYVAQ